MLIRSINEWHRRARPNPDAAAFNVQLGCHLEEVCEMLETLKFHLDGWPDTSGTKLALYEALKTVSDGLKAGEIKAEIIDREGMLDSLADQIVTAVGVGYCAGMRVPSALMRVDWSNYTKFGPSGHPTFDANGKIAKHESYTPPNLHGLF